MTWEHLFESLKRGYYTTLLMEATNFFVITVYAKKRIEITIYLFLLALTSLIQTLFVQYVDLTFNNLALLNRLTNISIYLYLAFEITFCICFMQKYIQPKSFKRVLSLINIIFVIAIFYYLISCPTSRNIVSIIGIIEGFMIIIPCLNYFYTLFKHPLNKGILHSVEFWAISGMVLLFSLITPFFMALDYLKRNYWLLEKKLYVINNLAYSLMFTMFTIGILLDKTQVSETKNN